MKLTKHYANFYYILHSNKMASRQALLVMDLQNSIITIVGEKSRPILQNTASILAKARSTKIPVIHVVFDVKPGFPSQKNKSFEVLNVLFANYANDDKAMAIHSDVAPIQGGDLPANLLLNM
jgi:nicotinamidase-related amidase